MNARENETRYECRINGIASFIFEALAEDELVL